MVMTVFARGITKIRIGPFSEFLPKFRGITFRRLTAVDCALPKFYLLFRRPYGVLEHMQNQSPGAGSERGHF